MKTTLQCSNPACSFQRPTTEEYLKTYGDAALICGCGETMARAPMPELNLDNTTIQLS
jgi:hypothetical protein